MIALLHDASGLLDDGGGAAQGRLGLARELVYADDTLLTGSSVATVQKPK